MNLTELSKEIHQGNVDRGFWEKKQEFGVLIALIHSELSEALEADRKGRWAYLPEDGFYFVEHGYSDGRSLPFEIRFKEHIKDTVEDEIADTIIRCLDLSAGFGIDIHKHVMLKLKFNATREHKHGKEY